MPVHALPGAALVGTPIAERAGRMAGGNGPDPRLRAVIMTHESTRDFVERTLVEIEQAALRTDDETATDAKLDETSWAVGRLSTEGLVRVGTFLSDLAQRAPLASPTFVGHRTVIEALESDIRRELERRSAREEGHQNGQARD